MGFSDRVDENGVSSNGGFQVVRYMPYQTAWKYSHSWFDMRVFYVRISNFLVDESTPEFLTLYHIPLNPDTLLEVNGSRCGTQSDGLSSLLRRDRVDKKSEEATYVCTDSTRFTGSVKFEVSHKEEVLLSGVLEMPSSNGSNGDSRKLWSLCCESEMIVGDGFLKRKHKGGRDYGSPAIEVYVAGSFSGQPIILTKTLQLSSRSRHNSKATLDVIPEHETSGLFEGVQTESSVSNTLHMQVAQYGNYKVENEEDMNDLYWRRADYMEGEDGELSWFNAGVRVGVGIGLGVCLGVGIGLGLAVRTYQSAARNFRRRLL